MSKGYAGMAIGWLPSQGRRRGKRGKRLTASHLGLGGIDVELGLKDYDLVARVDEALHEAEECASGTSADDHLRLGIDRSLPLECCGVLLRQLMHQRQVSLGAGVLVVVLLYRPLQTLSALHRIGAVRMPAPGHEESAQSAGGKACDERER